MFFIAVNERFVGGLLGGGVDSVAEAERILFRKNSWGINIDEED